jgi:hypothetical protein
VTSGPLVLVLALVPGLCVAMCKVYSDEGKSLGIIGNFSTGDRM